MKITTEPVRTGSGGFAIRVDDKAVAWVRPNGRAKLANRYRAELGDKPVPAKVREAIAKARTEVRGANGAAKKTAKKGGKK